MSKHRLQRRVWAGLLAAAALAIQAVPAAGATLPLWKVTDGAGHVLYLAGTMHALKASDYPLPQPFSQTFRASDRLVEEINLSQTPTRAAKRKALQMGMLNQGTLAQAMRGDWPKAKRLAKKAGVSLGLYAKLKPWFAAVELTELQLVHAGYRLGLGLDRHFSKQAQKRGMAIDGLETLREQLNFLDRMKPALQRRFLLQALREAPHAATQLRALHAAWKTGDVGKLDAMQKRDFRGFRHLRHRLLAERNEHWLPTLRRCLASGQTCFVAVGIEHMVGPHGLIAAMRKTGDRVRQINTHGGQ